MMRQALGETAIVALQDATLVHTPHGAILIDAPAGIHTIEPVRRALPALQAVVLSDDTMPTLGGLLALWDALQAPAQSRRSLHVLHGMHAERAATVAAAWSRGWPDGTQLEMDVAVPGQAVPVLAGVEVALVPLDAQQHVVQLHLAAGRLDAWPAHAHDPERLAEVSRGARWVLCREGAAPHSFVQRFQAAVWHVVGDDHQVLDPMTH